MSARIRLNGIECNCRIGVPEEERARPQKIVLDLELVGTPGTPYVDYFEATQAARRVAEADAFELVEELGAAVLEELSRSFMLDALRVSIHKWPAVMPGVEVVVDVERTR